MNMSASTLFNEQDKGSNLMRHDLFWENKMYKRKRSIGLNFLESNNRDG